MMNISAHRSVFMILRFKNLFFIQRHRFWQECIYEAVKDDEVKDFRFLVGSIILL